MSDDLKIDRIVVGDIQQSGKTSEVQKSASEFVALVDSILDTPGVTAFRWTQFTPYFNDGDSCEFGFGYDKSVQLDEAVFGPLNEDNFDNEAGYDAPGLWFGEYDLSSYPNGYSQPRLYEVNGVDTLEIYNALVKFEEQQDHFLNVVRANFGDHAQVVATKDGFSVNEYSHD